jgi:hypothetical protein
MADNTNEREMEQNMLDIIRGPSDQQVDPEQADDYDGSEFLVLDELDGEQPVDNASEVYE